jgi:hypothetical protein
VLVVGLTILAIYISRALLVIFGAMVFASLLDGGERLVGKVIKIGRGWRLGIVLALTGVFFVWLGQFAGTQISREGGAAARDRHAPGRPADRLARQPGASRSTRATSRGIAGQLLSGVGLVTRAIGGVFGAVSTLFLIAVMGIYVALEPRVYERGVAWMLAPEQREDFGITAARMGATMRRLMAGRLVGMVFEGAFTWFMLWIYGGADGGAARHPHRLARVHPQPRRADRGRADGAGRVLRRDRHGVVHDHGLLPRADLRRLGGDPADRQEDRRPRPGAGARGAADHGACCSGCSGCSSPIRCWRCSRSRSSGAPRRGARDDQRFHAA